MGRLWCQIQLCLEDASLHWEAHQWTPREEPGDVGCACMTEGLRGHNVTCDNFLTSYELGQQRLKRKIIVVGTVRKNKPQLPPALRVHQSKERSSHQSLHLLGNVTPLIRRREHLACTEASADVKAVQAAAAMVARSGGDQPASLANQTSPQLWLGQVRGKGFTSAHQRKTLKHILCAAGVTNISAKAVHCILPYMC